jgi:hypothetical protein
MSLRGQIAKQHKRNGELEEIVGRCAWAVLGLKLPCRLLVQSFKILQIMTLVSD